MLGDVERFTRGMRCLKFNFRLNTQSESEKKQQSAIIDLVEGYSCNYCLMTADSITVLP